MIECDGEEGLGGGGEMPWSFRDGDGGVLI